MVGHLLQEDDLPYGGSAGIGVPAPAPGLRAPRFSAPEHVWRCAHLAECALSIRRILKGVEDLLDRNHLLGLKVRAFPHDAIGALAELLRQIVPPGDGLVHFLGHGAGTGPPPIWGGPKPRWCRYLSTNPRSSGSPTSRESKPKTFFSLLFEVQPIPGFPRGSPCPPWKLLRRSYHGLNRLRNAIYYDDSGRTLNSLRRTGGLASCRQPGVRCKVGIGARDQFLSGLSSVRPCSFVPPLSATRRYTVPS